MWNDVFAPDNIRYIPKTYFSNVNQKIYIKIEDTKKNENRDKYLILFQYKNYNFDPYDYYYDIKFINSRYETENNDNYPFKISKQYNIYNTLSFLNIDTYLFNIRNKNCGYGPLQYYMHQLN